MTKLLKAYALLKKIVYWATIVRPVYDIFAGAVRGVKLGLDDLKKEREKSEFDKANR